MERLVRQIEVISKLGTSFYGMHKEIFEHNQAVENWFMLFALHCGFDPKISLLFANIARLHDIGKYQLRHLVPYGSPNKLTDKQWEINRQHPTIGCKIMLETGRFSEQDLGIVLYHHERWDGLGYPFGLQGKQIPLYARMASICDAVSVMRSKRAYWLRQNEREEPMSFEEISEELRKCSGFQFDPSLVKEFIAMLLTQKQLKKSM